MPNHNGNLILHTLMNLKEPTTMREIVSIIAKTAQVQSKDIKCEIIDTLEQGVRFGYIQRVRRRYYAEPLNEAAVHAINRSVMELQQLRESRGNSATRKPVAADTRKRKNDSIWTSSSAPHRSSSRAPSGVTSRVSHRGAGRSLSLPSSRAQRHARGYRL